MFGRVAADESKLIVNDKQQATQQRRYFITAQLSLGFYGVQEIRTYRESTLYLG